MNRFLLGTIALLLLAALIGYLTSADINILVIAQLLAIVMMLINGTFLKSSLFKFASFAIGLAILGTLFKILHWTGADELLVCSSIALFIVYVVYFILKQNKRRIDVLKVLTLFSLLFTRLAFILHFIPYEHKEKLIAVNSAILWLTFLDFFYTARKDGVLLNK